MSKPNTQHIVLIWANFLVEDSSEKYKPGAEYMKNWCVSNTLLHFALLSKAATSTWKPGILVLLTRILFSKEAFAQRVELTC